MTYYLLILVDLVEQKCFGFQEIAFIFCDIIASCMYMISAKWLNIFIKVIVDKWLEHNEFVFRRSTKWILWQYRGSSRSWLQIPHRSGRFGLHVPLWQSSTKTPTRYFLWHSSISFQGIIPVQLSDRHSSLQVFYYFLSWWKILEIVPVVCFIYWCWSCIKCW